MLPAQVSLAAAVWLFFTGPSAAQLYLTKPVMNAADACRFARAEGVWCGAGPNGVYRAVMDRGTSANRAVEYDVWAPKAGAYEIDMFYNSGEPRPVNIVVNDKVVGHALDEPTAGWKPADKKWSQKYPIELMRGWNTVGLVNYASFPHVLDMRRSLRRNPSAIEFI